MPRRLPYYGCGNRRQRRQRRTRPRRKPARAPEENTARTGAGKEHRYGGQEQRDLPDQPERCTHAVGRWPNTAREIPEEKRAKPSDENDDRRRRHSRRPPPTAEQREQREEHDGTR